jgi:hypothetical protein
MCFELTAIGRFYLAFVKNRSLRKTLGVLFLGMAGCAKVSLE